MDWEKIGLKCGLEIHQQLGTRKLFCNCPSEIIDRAPDFEVKRKLRAAAGEMGIKDIAAQAEENKDRTFIYQGYIHDTCLVELDEEPPRELNKKALNAAFEVGLLLKMNFFDEIQVMRKTVVDGSNTSGFQRTSLIGENGYLDTSFGRVGVDMMALEEDAARIISKGEKEAVYRLDRLGIPLIELRTEPDMHTPEQVKEVAEKLGLFMRMTGKVKRGLGTIRQDVNVSIKDGARVEIKGFQELGDIPKVVKLEAERQHSLVEIKKELKIRKASVGKEIKEVTAILKTAENSKFVKNAIDRGEKFFGICLKGFGGIFKRKISGEMSFAKEIVGYLKHFTDFKGFIHTDELPGYGIEENNVFQLKKLFDCGDYDLVLFVTSDSKEGAGAAFNIIQERAVQLMKGIPSEVRFVNEDLTTYFLRPMPGAERMYPETDVLPVVTKEFLKGVKRPFTPEERLKRYEKLGLSEDLAKQVLHSQEMIVFEEIQGKFEKLNPTFVASTVLSVKDEIRKRYNADTKNLEEKHFEQSFELLAKDKIAKEAVIEILVELAREPSLTAGDAMKKLMLTKISKKELERIAEQIMKENPELVKNNQFGVLMGFLMRKVRGRIDGELVAETLKKKMFKK